MPLFGTLKTMPLTDLLQWLGSARATGILQIEYDNVAKRILLRQGQIVGCSSDDPPERLGQFLIARGKLSEEQLREALTRQERVGRHLGRILVDMGALPADELADHLEAKAEETILSLFDRPDAVFRFQDDASDEANAFPISLRVEEVLLRGVKRFDEMQRIRQVFSDPGMVLRRTAKAPPPELLHNQMARTLYEAIDGDRTVADIQLHVHGSEFVVNKFLFDLERNGYAAIVGVKKIVPIPAEVTAAPPAPGPDTAAELHREDPWHDIATGGGQGDATAADPLAVDDPPATPACTPQAFAPAASAEHPARSAPAVLAPDATIGSVDLRTRLHEARAAMDRGDYELALIVFEDLNRAFPGDESLRRLAREAEQAFVDKAYRYFLPPAKVPRLTRPIEELATERLSPTEFFLLSRIGGKWDVRSITQIAPLREVDTLRVLKRLRETGVIELQESAES